LLLLKADSFGGAWEQVVPPSILLRRRDRTTTTDDALRNSLLVRTVAAAAAGVAFLLEEDNNKQESSHDKALNLRTKATTTSHNLPAQNNKSKRINDESDVESLCSSSSFSLLQGKRQGVLLLLRTGAVMGSPFFSAATTAKCSCSSVGSSFSEEEDDDDKDVSILDIC